MPVVSDTSPLILLAKVGLLELLRLLFAEVLIPPAVRRELDAGNLHRPEAVIIRQATWIRVHTNELESANEPKITDRLGPGEAAAIRSTLRLSPQPIILLDDLEGRRAAESLGLRITGTGGVIVLAKRAGLIPEARSTLLALQSSGMYLTDNVMSALLTAAGEANQTGADFASR